MTYSAVWLLYNLLLSHTAYSHAQSQSITSQSSYSTCNQGKFINAQGQCQVCPSSALCDGQDMLCRGQLAYTGSMTAAGCYDCPADASCSDYGTHYTLCQPGQSVTYGACWDNNKLGTVATSAPSTPPPAMLCSSGMVPTTLNGTSVCIQCADNAVCDGVHMYQCPYMMVNKNNKCAPCDADEFFLPFTGGNPIGQRCYPCPDNNVCDGGLTFTMCLPEQTVVNNICVGPVTTVTLPPTAAPTPLPTVNPLTGNCAPGLSYSELINMTTGQISNKTCSYNGLCQPGTYETVMEPQGVSQCLPCPLNAICPDGHAVILCPNGMVGVDQQCVLPGSVTASPSPVAGSVATVAADADADVTSSDATATITPTVPYVTAMPTMPPVVNYTTTVITNSTTAPSSPGGATTVSTDKHTSSAPSSQCTSSAAIVSSAVALIACFTL